MYKDRLDLYNDLEGLYNSKLIVYITGDRRGLETQIHQEAVDFFVEHLDSIVGAERITLYLYTLGGNTLAAWSIVNLIRQFCEEFEVIVPSKAHSAGTLICLGANKIIMTKQSTLGPIDPSVNTVLNPAVPGRESDPKARIPVSVEAINGFFDLAKELGINEGANLTSVLSDLTSHIHPLVLGQVYRTRGQIRMLGERLLRKHMTDTDNEKIGKILDFLCSESGSHDYTIYRQEARNELGLNVETPNETCYKVIKSIYNDIANELEFTKPYDPKVMLGSQSRTTYNLSRCLIESSRKGIHRFVSKGEIIKNQIKSKKGITQEAIQDNRTFEGWTYEDAKN